MRIHLTDALHVVEIPTIDAVIWLLFDDEERAACFGVGFCVKGGRPRHNVCYLFEAGRVQDVDVDYAGCVVVPDCCLVRVFVYILDCMRSLEKSKYNTVGDYSREVEINLLSFPPAARPMAFKSCVSTFAASKSSAVPITSSSPSFSPNKELSIAL